MGNKDLVEKEYDILSLVPGQPVFFKVLCIFSPLNYAINIGSKSVYDGASFLLGCFTSLDTYIRMISCHYFPVFDWK